MKQLLIDICKSLVEHPECISISELVTPNTIFYEIYTAPGEAGRIIGKKGKMIDAIRTIMQSIGAKEVKRVFVELPENK